MARFPASVLLVLLAAALWAQDSQASSSRSAPKAKSSLPDSGAISQGVYRNSAFGFSYKLPFGWVDRTADMQDDSADAFKSRVLLAIFERPPEATGDTINSAVVIAAEPLPAGHEDSRDDYFESLAGLTTAKGFQAEESLTSFRWEPRSWYAETSASAGHAHHASDLAGPGAEGATQFRSRSSEGAKTK